MDDIIFVNYRPVVRFTRRRKNFGTFFIDPIKSSLCYTARMAVNVSPSSVPSKNINPLLNIYIYIRVRVIYFIYRKRLANRSAGQTTWYAAVIGSNSILGIRYRYSRIHENVQASAFGWFSLSSRGVRVSESFRSIRAMPLEQLSRVSLAYILTFRTPAFHSSLAFSKKQFTSFFSFPSPFLSLLCAVELLSSRVYFTRVIQMELLLRKLTSRGHEQNG